MPSAITLLRVVVVSPSDVKPERDSLQEVLDSINRDSAHQRGLHLHLSGWEADAYPGFHPEGPQAIIDPVIKIEDSDVVIGIFWTRFGTPTANGQTGTEHELKKAYEAWQKKGWPQVMIYFNAAPYNPKNSGETEQWSQVFRFKDNFPKEGLWWPYEGKDNFSKLVERHLRNFINSRFSKSEVVLPNAAPLQSSTLPIPGPTEKGPVGNHRRRTRLIPLYAVTVLSILLVVTVIYILYLIANKKKPPVGEPLIKEPLILLGSGNVYPYLRGRVHKPVWDDLEPIWIDLGSEDAQKNAFGIFTNANSARNGTVGFIAMSSDGIGTLAKLVNSDKSEDPNYFLRIIIARPPLAVFYRSPDRFLKTHPGNKLPQGFRGGLLQPYEFVNLTDLKLLIKTPYLETTKHIQRYFPGGNSGTKRLFSEAAARDGWKDMPDWSTVKNVSNVLGFIEDYGKSSFVEIASELQGSRNGDPNESCEALNNQKVKAAVICTRSASPTDFFGPIGSAHTNRPLGPIDPTNCRYVVRTEFDLIFKLQHIEEGSVYKYKIPDGRECRLAREMAEALLDGNEQRDKRDLMTADCKIEHDAQPKGHTYTLDWDNNTFPKYLGCKSDGKDIASR